MSESEDDEGPDSKSACSRTSTDDCDDHDNESNGEQDDGAIDSDMDAIEMAKRYSIEDDEDGGAFAGFNIDIEARSLCEDDFAGLF